MRFQNIKQKYNTQQNLSSLPVNVRALHFTFYTKYINARIEYKEKKNQPNIYHKKMLRKI